MWKENVGNSWNIKVRNMVLWRRKKYWLQKASKLRQVWLMLRSNESICLIKCYRSFCHVQLVNVFNTGEGFLLSSCTKYVQYWLLWQPQSHYVTNGIMEGATMQCGCYGSQSPACQQLYFYVAFKSHSLTWAFPIDILRLHHICSGRIDKRSCQRIFPTLHLTDSEVKASPT